MKTDKEYNEKVEELKRATDKAEERHANIRDQIVAERKKYDKIIEVFTEDLRTDRGTKAAAMFKRKNVLISELERKLDQANARADAAEKLLKER